jgi:ubiquinone/menaquinone biosynthesis C-methylase UbiE
LKDHYSIQAANYVRYRPTYPTELFSFLSELVPNKETALDCGTGNGQCAIGLSEYFNKVIAIDTSSTQLLYAIERDNIEYKLGNAEKTDLPDKSIDLITTACSAHWFDINLFYNEVERLLKSGGVLAIWTYFKPRIEQKINKVLDEYYDEILGDYWVNKTSHVSLHYQEIPFPFNEVRLSQTFMSKMNWNYQNLKGFLQTESGNKEFVSKNSFDPINLINDKLKNSWGESDLIRTVYFELFIKIGKK